MTNPPQLELVFTLENTSDSVTCWAANHAQAGAEDLLHSSSLPLFFSQMLVVHAGAGVRLSQFGSYMQPPYRLGSPSGTDHGNHP